MYYYYFKKSTKSFTYFSKHRYFITPEWENNAKSWIDMRTTHKHQRVFLFFVTLRVDTLQLNDKKNMCKEIDIQNYTRPI